MHRQQQQMGAQVQRQQSHGRGTPPAEAVCGREGQDHEFADQDAAPGAQPRPGSYPASSLPNSTGDNTPGAPSDREREVIWDDIVQPVHAPVQAPVHAGESETPETARRRRDQARRQSDDAG